MGRIEEHWASFFGLSIDDFDRQPMQIVPHRSLGDYCGVWMLKIGSVRILSAPPDMVGLLRAAVKAHGAGSPFEGTDLIETLEAAVVKVVGPAYQGFLPEEDFRPSPSTARLLTSSDASALLELSRGCSEEDWEHSDIGDLNCPTFGLYAEGRLAAVANYRMEAISACAPGVITHPAFRGHGYGSAVLSAATADALNKGYLVLYQTLLSNLPAITIAEQLGYRQYGESLAVRLRG